MEQGPYRHLRRPSLCPCRGDFPDLSTSTLAAPLPEMLPIPHSWRPSSGDTTSGSPQCSPVTQQTGSSPRSSPWPPAWGPTLALREEKHKGTQRCCALPSHQWQWYPWHPRLQATLRKPTWSFLARRKSPHPRWRGEARDFRAFFCTMAQPFLERPAGMDIGPP